MLHNSLYSVTATVTRRVELLIRASSEHEAEAVAEERLLMGENGMEAGPPEIRALEASLVETHPHDDSTGFFT